jgi:hypothetical protein
MFHVTDIVFSFKKGISKYLNSHFDKPPEYSQTYHLEQLRMDSSHIHKLGALYVCLCDCVNICMYL